MNIKYFYLLIFAICIAAPVKNTFNVEGMMCGYGCVSKINSIVSPCSDLWRRMFVWWDGKINPCDVDYKSQLSTGNIVDGNLSKIWRSETYEDLRNNHLKNLRKSSSPCNKCSVV